jgi:hypothetical protein
MLARSYLTTIFCFSSLTNKIIFCLFLASFPLRPSLGTPLRKQPGRMVQGPAGGRV